MVTVGVIFVVHFKYDLFLYVLIAGGLIYKNLGPADHSDIAKVPNILHVINFNDVISAQYSRSWECNWRTKKRQILMSGAQNLNIPYCDVTDYRLLCGNCSLIRSSNT